MITISVFPDDNIYSITITFDHFILLKLTTFFQCSQIVKGGRIFYYGTSSGKSNLCLCKSISIQLPKAKKERTSALWQCCPCSRRDWMFLWFHIGSRWCPCLLNANFWTACYESADWDRGSAACCSIYRLSSRMEKLQNMPTNSCMQDILWQCYCSAEVSSVTTLFFISLPFILQK